MASTDAKHIPVKNAAYRITFPIFDADGDLVTGATGLDSEVSIDAGTFTDCTNEATEIATSSGMYYLDLTAAEMNGDTIAVIVKTSTSGAKTTPIVLYTAARSVNDLAYPTVSGRSLDVSAGGEAGVDWANVGSPTTTLNLSGTTIKTATDVETDTQDIQGRLPAALTGSGSIKAALQNEAHGGAAAVLTLERLIATSVTSNQAAVKLTGNGSAGGLELLGGSTGPGATATAGAFANTGGMILTGKGSGPGLGLLPGPTGHGLYALSGSSSGDAIRGEKVGSGNAFNLVGSVTVVVETFLNNLINRLGAFTGTGTNTVLGFFLALFKKDVTAPSDVGGTYDPATDSLEANRDNLGTNGAALTLAKTTNLTGFNDLDAADVRTALGMATANLDTQLDALPTASEIADAVWDEPLTDHNTEDSVGNVLNDLTDEDGDGVYQFTINALENAPSGSGGGSTAADIWAYATRTLTQGAASVIAAVIGSSITVYRGTTWSISLTGLGNIALYNNIYLSVKVSEDDSDDNAILRVKNTASGLLRLNKAAPTAASNGTITVTDSVNGNITITVNEAETQNEPLGQYLYDIKGVDTDGSVVMLSAGGQFNIRGDITRLIT